jgi:hypothetical protein
MQASKEVSEGLAGFVSGGWRAEELAQNTEVASTTPILQFHVFCVT